MSEYPDDWQPIGLIQDQPHDVLSKYRGEAMFTTVEGTPVSLLVTAEGSARTVARVIEAAADAFAEDAER